MELSAAAQARNHEILRNFLDLQNPQLTEKMVDFFQSEGVAQVLFGFVSRLPPGATPASLLGTVFILACLPHKQSCSHCLFSVMCQTAADAKEPNRKRI